MLTVTVVRRKSNFESIRVHNAVCDWGETGGECGSRAVGVGKGRVEKGKQKGQYGTGPGLFVASFG